nr:glycosyltransferase family 39 protein [Anaerolineae bacterium]
MKISLRIVLFLGLILAAAFLRLGWPGISEFKYDEATVMRSALALVEEGIWPTHGVTSSLGVPHPPLVAYLLALPAALSRNPALAVAFMGLLGVGSAVLLFWLISRFFDHRVALLGLLFYTFSPWAIYYSRKLWSQHVPLITLVFVTGLCLLVIERKPWAWALVLGGLGAMLGLHLGGIAFFAILILSLALYPGVLSTFRKQLSAAIPSFVGGMLLLLLLTAPYFFGYLLKGEGLSHLIGAIKGGPSDSSFSLLSIRYAAHIATGYQFHALAGEQYLDFYRWLSFPNLNTLVDGILLWLIIAAMIYCPIKAAVLLIRGYRQGSPDGAVPHAGSARYVLLSLWIWIPVLMWIASRGDVHPHHFILLYPAQFIALADGFNSIYEWLSKRLVSSNLRRLLHTGIAVTLFLVFLWQAVEYIGMLYFIRNGNLTDGFGTPAGVIWQAAREARSLADAEALPVVAYTSGVDPNYQHGAAEIDSVLGDQRLIFADRETMVVIPDSPYVDFIDHEGQSYEVIFHHAPGGGSGVGEARLSNGLEVVSIEPATRAVIQGEPFVVQASFRIIALEENGPDYSYTFNLFDSTGQRWAQRDGPFLLTCYWDPGDVVVLTIGIPVDIDAPSGAGYDLIIGFYSVAPTGDFQGVDILDEAGNPAGQYLVIPLAQ